MRATRSLRLLLCPPALLLALHAGAQSPAGAPDPAATATPASETAAAGDVATDAAAGETAAVEATTGEDGATLQRPVSRPDLVMLEERLPAERRLLSTADGEFAVFVTTAIKLPARGAVVLIPGDGEHPAASQQLEQLRHALPAHGWNTWLLSLDVPPLTQALLKIDEPVPGSGDASAGEGATEGTTEADAAAAEPPQPEPPQETGAAVAAQPTPPGDTQPAQHPPADAAEDPMLGWSRAAEARIASATAAAAAAAADGPVALVAADSAAALLIARLAGAPEQVFAALLINPTTIPGLDPDWPEELAVPVLEILEPGDAMETGAKRRERALRARVQSYQQLTLAAQPFDASPEQLLTRRVRGWLQRLSEPPAAD